VKKADPRRKKGDARETVATAVPCRAGKGRGSAPRDWGGYSGMTAFSQLLKSDKLGKRMERPVVSIL
jgi:hypothetical protein